MELFQTDLHYIILDGEFSLWCNRSNGKLEPKIGCDVEGSEWGPVCVGHVYGIIGKLKLHPDSEWRLLLIKQQSLVCQLAGQYNIYRINKIAVLPLTTGESAADLDLEVCRKHSSKKPETDASHLQRTWHTLKTAAESVKSKKKETKDKEKFEKRILEELMKMYNGSNYFYYSHDFDVTTSLQRQYSQSYDRSLPLWKRADERFFWNKHMLLELMETNDPLSDHWMVPVIQGFVQMEKSIMDFDEDKKLDMSSSVDFPSRRLEPLGYTISIISRRSRHRAGTRSRKRGINANGACANYVETEQIIEFTPHLVSFVQVRGSIPVFWSQSGFKYRPPPQLDKDFEESHSAFVQHFDEQLSLYQKVAIVTLAELTGKEHIIGEAYMSHVIKFNSPDITFITFDFHEYCRGMRFENVSILTEGIKDVIKDMRYCWVDTKGIICEQKGVFRVNCVDCLDRTNVVQTAVARIVMETQFRKLGLLPPEENLPSSCRRTYQQIWANNGDVISRQYAGTAALKGDFTRTGERKLSGLMKDGVNSASRYYLRFRDAYRQAAIDLTLGQPVSESLLVPSSEGDEVDVAEASEKEENVKMMIEDCKKMLIVEPEQCLGCWGVINADPVEGDSDQQDMDMIILLSQRSLYIAWYDDDKEQVTKYQRIYLEDIDRIEIGMEPAMFKSKHPCMRIVYHYGADEGLFHMFRLPPTRFFNNKSTGIMSQEEAKDSLRLIADTFKSVQQFMIDYLEVVEKPKLEKKKATIHPGVMDILQQQQENSLASIRLPRDISSEMNSSVPDPDGMTTLQPELNPGVEVVNPRSKSPLDFLPMTNSALFSSINKSLTNASARFSIPKANLKENLQNFNLIRKIRKGNENNNGDKSEKGHANLDHDSRSSLLEETNKDVVLDSCGILASSPNQILLSSIHLKAENKRSSTHSESSLKLEQTPTMNEDLTARVFNFEDMASNIRQKTKQDTDTTDGIHKFKDDPVSRKSPFVETTNVQDNMQQHLCHDGLGHLEANDEEADEDYCVLENEEVRAILDKCHQLNHPHMKTSLSDTTLSKSLGSTPDENILVAQTTKMDPRDSNIVSRLKLKMTGLSKPSSGKPVDPVPAKPTVRKSPYSVGLFNQLKKEHLPAEDCRSIFVFI